MPIGSCNGSIAGKSCLKCHGRAGALRRDPAIHVFLLRQDVDARHKAWHDGLRNHEYSMTDVAIPNAKPVRRETTAWERLKVNRNWIALWFMLPAVLSAIAFWWIYDAQFSIVSWSLRHMGLIDGNINFLGDFWNARWSTIFANIWRGIPFVAITLLAGLQ